MGNMSVTQKTKSLLGHPGVIHLFHFLLLLYTTREDQEIARLRASSLKCCIIYLRRGRSTIGHKCPDQDILASSLCPVPILAKWQTFRERYIIAFCAFGCDGLKNYILSITCNVSCSSIYILASCPLGPATAHGVGILTEMDVICIRRYTSHIHAKNQVRRSIGWNRRGGYTWTDGRKESLTIIMDT